MSVHCETCGQAKYLAKLVPKIEESRGHFLGLLQEIESIVAPNRKGQVQRKAADKVLALLMDDARYMEAK